MATTAQIYSLCEKQKDHLKAELSSLKGCQITFLNLAVTGTGVILALLRRSANDEPTPAFAFLVPLVVLIPTWWIFFDKAKTITRIVGYYRYVEAVLLGGSVPGMTGWENDLASFRVSGADIYDDLKSKKAIPKGKVTAYWKAIFGTYLVLSCASLALCANYATDSTSWLAFGIAAAMTAWTTIENSVIVFRLGYGKYSYLANYEIWKKLLS